jgi:mycothiol synthase
VNDTGIRVTQPGVDGSEWVLNSIHPLSEDELQVALEKIAHQGGGPTELWIDAVTDADDRVAVGNGFIADRELWQLRCPLPPPASILPVRSFGPEDAAEFIDVNNRAFSWHPEQGGMTGADLERRQAEPWYDEQGFLIHERDGRIAGFCWTKIHPDTEPPMGEIYVIGVDPDFHGQGIGGPLTLAGLKYLSDRGLTVGMLYVESDNDPANTIYRRIGFSRHQANRAYNREVPPA